jgi:hypothetical protein
VAAGAVIAIQADGIHLGDRGGGRDEGHGRAESAAQEQPQADRHESDDAAGRTQPVGRRTLPGVLGLHFALAILAAAGLVVVAVVAALLRRLGREGIAVLDRAILATLAVVAAGVVTGLVIALTDRGPADPLHLLYALLALIALPIGRAAGAGPRDRRLGRTVLFGAAIGLAAVLRLFMTGG